MNSISEEERIPQDKNSQLLTRLPVVALLAFVCCFLWGSASPSIKSGYALLNIQSSDTPTILLFAGMRFTLAGILTLIVCSFLRRKVLVPRKDSVKNVLALALVQTTAQYLFFYIGLAHASGVKGSIMVSTNVFLSILVSAWVFRSEKLTARNVVGCLVGFAGIVIVNVKGGSGPDMSMSFLGEGFVVLASLSYAVSVNMIKSFARTEDPFTLSGWQFLCGGLILASVGFAAGGRISGWSTASVLLLFYLAFISATAYTLWSVLVKYNPVSRVSIFGFLNPLCGVLLSALFLNEAEQAFNIRGLAAMLLVSVGIFIVNSKGLKPGSKQ